ncbi:MAG: hypothetical protein ACOC2W_01315 [bacterium]
MPWKTFNNYLFDGKYHTEPPEEITKSSSPISNLYCISLFMKCGKLNHYLNKYLNNYGVFYIPKDEMFKFIKKCIRDFKISKKDIWYFSKKQKKTDLYDVLSERHPLLKEYEIYHLCDIINKSKNKNEILQGLGLKSDVKKSKVNKKDKKNKQEKKNNKKDDDTNINNFITKNFVIMEVKK